MVNGGQSRTNEAGSRPPSLATGLEKRRIERRLHDAGVLCQPEVSIQYQQIARRSVLRGVESGGASKDVGRYVTFCDDHGERIAWLQPIDSVAMNGRHAVVIAIAFVSVEVLRMRNTYDVLIARHEAIQADGRLGRIESRVLFRGREGHLPLDLTGLDKSMAGEILPEFFTKAGEPIEAPPMFLHVARAAVRGANGVYASTLLDCTEIFSAGRRRGPGDIDGCLIKSSERGYGETEECGSGVLPIRCPDGDLQQLC